MASSSIFSTVVFFPRRRWHARTTTISDATAINHNHHGGGKAATKKLLLRRRKRPIILLFLMLLLFLASTGLLNYHHHHHRLGEIHQSRQEEENVVVSRDAHHIFRVVPATNSSTNTAATDNKSPRLYSESSSIPLRTTTVHALYPPPISIGPCHNLSWWTTNAEGSSRSNNDNTIPPRSLNINNKPIWVASFPGSGAEMFRQLIESLTGGLPAWSVYTKDNSIQNRTCLDANAATCKTHWPVLSFRPVLFPNRTKNKGNGRERIGEKDYSTDNNNDNTTAAPPFTTASSTTNSGYDGGDDDYDDDAHHYYYHSQAIILLRNPVSAYPSRFNHHWESKREIDHVRQAPENAWNSWIQKTFHHQQEAFFEFVTTWANLTRAEQGEGEDKNNEASRVALFVPYEGLIDPKQGPVWTRKIIRVLHQAGTRHVDVGDDGDDNDHFNSKLLETDLAVSGYNHNKHDHTIKCVWKDAIFDRPLRKRAPHTYKPGYTREQQEHLQIMFRRLFDTIYDLIDTNNNSNNSISGTATTAITRAQRDLLSILNIYQQSIQFNESESLTSIRILP